MEKCSVCITKLKYNSIAKLTELLGDCGLQKLWVIIITEKSNSCYKSKYNVMLLMTLICFAVVYLTLNWLYTWGFLFVHARVLQKTTNEYE